MQEKPSFDKYPFKGRPADFIHIENLYTTTDKGYCLNGTHYTSLEHIFEHLLVIGSTGSGKSKKVIIPSIANINHSMVVYDPHQELHELMHTFLSKRGFHIQVLSFTQQKARFNPLAHINPHSDTRWIARLLTTAGREIGVNESHWIDKSATLISTLIHLAFCMHEIPTLPQVYDLLLQAESNPSRIRQLFDKHKADDYFKKKFMTFAVNKTNEVSSIFSSASKALDDYSDPVIQQVSSGDDISPRSLRAKPTVLFIQANPVQMDMYRKPVSVFLEVFWLNVQTTLTKQCKPISFFIDEADTLYLPTLPSLLSQVRKYLISLVLVYQSHAQIKASHKEYQTIIENTKNHIYLGAQKAETAEKIEQQLGKISGSDEYRAPREKLRTMSPDEAIILTHGQPPIFTETIPFYSQDRFQELIPSSAPYDE